MSSISGEAATSDAPRIIRRLCKHWSHKFETQHDDSSGMIQLNEVKVTLRAEPGLVSVTLENPQGEVPQRLLGVVAEHMQRMAGADVQLAVKWSEPVG